MGAPSRFSIVDSNSLHTIASRQLFDLVVVGGGITGAGVARDAVLRGMTVLLLERGDIAQGTSSRSSRLIHGGLRYLEKLKLGLVHESVSERWHLMKAAPHLARPLPFLFPAYEGQSPGLATLNAGTLVYSMLSAFRTPGSRSTLSPSQAQTRAPGLRGMALTGGARYFDCATDDARLTLEVTLDAVQSGAVVLPCNEVVDIAADGAGAALQIRHASSGTTWTARGRLVVLALGPWTDGLLGKAVPSTPRWLRPTKGVHLVVRRDRLPILDALVMKTQPDHRVIFAIPWGTHTYVGTTDTDYPNPAAEPTVEAADARYLLDCVNHYFPDAHLGVGDVVSVWAGLRPLVAPEDEVDPTAPVNPSDVSREEKIELYDDRFLAVAGGKLTTWRLMAERVTDRAAGALERRCDLRFRPCSTQTRPLPGGTGSDPAALTAEFNDLPADWVTASVDRLGSRAVQLFDMAREDRSLLEPLPGTAPLRLADVHFSVLHEHASTVEDLLTRRTQVYYKADDQGAAAAPVVAEVLRSLGAVPAERASAMVTAYLDGLREWKARLSQAL